MKNVPSPHFPFITCYARTIDRITSLPLNDYEDSLTNPEPWELGSIYYKGGCSQKTIEFQIWNNEERVSGGSTQRLFNDAKDCMISAFKDEDKNSLDNNISVNIRKSKGNESFTRLNGNYPVYGEIYNDCKILHGNGESFTFQISIDVLKFQTPGKYNFVICFTYNDSGTTVDLFFECSVNIIIELDIDKIEVGENRGTFIGEIGGLTTGLIEAYRLNGCLCDQQILKSNRYSLFLESGKYNFVIKSPSVRRDFNDVTVNGIFPYYSQVVSGVIKEIYTDIVRYFDGINTITEVNGKLVDEYDNPLIGASIIVTKEKHQIEELVTFYKTDDHGRYQFILEDGIYNVRVLCKDRRVKIVRNFKFDGKYGFFSEIRHQIQNFNKDFKIITHYKRWFDEL